MTRKVKTSVAWFVLLSVLFAIVFVQNSATLSETVSSELAQQLLSQGQIASFRMESNGLILRDFQGGEYRVGKSEIQDVATHLSRAGIPHKPAESGILAQMVIWWLPVLIFLIIFLYLLKKFATKQTANLFELRKSKARPVSDADKARFADIGGNQEAVELLEDIVDFLKAPDRWTAAGARIPRGVLVVGPPGTGKTLLARAVAGETNSAFLYTSAAEFVELFVGIGAARVRDTFEKAGAQQPAVVFIDELDAIGRRRGSSVGTMHEEREQTLNQLLISLDGLEHRSRVVVMAATNRPDVLDPALLRSGRFDRMLTLGLPAAHDRIDILKIHTRNKLLAEDVSLEWLSRLTENFSGADLEALTNEAALRAVRRLRHSHADDQHAVTLTMSDFELSREAMVKSNRKFDRLDSVLVESVSQFAEPTGRAVTRIILSTGATVQGEIVWMNPSHIKLKVADGSEVIIAKETAVQLIPLAGTESAAEGDFQPDRWTGRSPEVG